MNSRKPFPQILWESRFRTSPVKERSLELLRGLQTEDFPFLLDGLEDEEPYVRLRAKKAIRQILYRCSPAELSIYLEHPHPLIRILAIYCLRQFSGQEQLQGMEKVTKCLSDPDVSVVRSAVIVLSQAEVPPVAELMMLAKSKINSAQCYAQTVLEQIEKPDRYIKVWNARYMRMNQPLLSHTPKSHKPYASFVTEEEKTKKLSESMWTEQLLSENEHQAWEAFHSLQSSWHTPQNDLRACSLVANLDKASETSFQTLLYFMKSLGKRFLAEGLEKSLADSILAKRRLAILLGYFDEKNSFPILLRLTQDPNLTVRMNAIKSLGKCHSTSCFEHLQALSDDSDSRIRAQVARTWGQLRDVQAVKMLNALAWDSFRRVRYAAIQALGECGEPALEGLSVLLKNGDREMQAQALEAMAKLRPQDNWQVVFEKLKDPQNLIRKKAALVLTGWALPEVVEALIGVLNEQSHPGRYDAAYALGNCGSPAAVGPLCQLLKSEVPDLRKQAAIGLGNLRRQKASPDLEEALSDEDWRVAKEAKMALSKLHKQRPRRERKY